MSSANRGRERNKDDLYETPHWLSEALVPRLSRLFHFQGVSSPTILDPCCGNGRIARVIEHHFPKAVVVKSDIQEYPDLDSVVDFLEHSSFWGQEFDLIIFNPPFIHAQQFIEKACTLLTAAGKVIVLERMNFLGSKQREPWLSTHVPSQNFSPRRPSFLPTRTADSVEYSWFEFDTHENWVGTFQYLDTLSCDICSDAHYTKICHKCDYGYCRSCANEHQCKFFGKDFLWGCVNHPDVEMHACCKDKVNTVVGGKSKKVVCGLPLCVDCWETHTHEQGDSLRSSESLVV